MSPRAFDPNDEGPNDDAPGERQVISIRMAENEASGAKNQITHLVADAFERALTALEADRGETLPSGLKTGAVSAVRALLGAGEGVLTAKSLEGALKEAEIVNTYAAAELSRVQAQQVSVETAWTHLLNTLSLFEKLGAKSQLITRDGRPVILIGDGLAEIPFPGAAAPAAQLAPPAG